VEAAHSQLDILLVEDNLEDAEMLCLFCRKTLPVPPRWIFVRDGEEALAFLEQQGRYEGTSRPRVIILDIGLPKRSGWEILAAIRARPALNSIPVVILSGILSKSDEAQRDQLKPALCLTKPTTLTGYQHVATHIEALLRQTPTG
jgi:chemotaxis family two-component system response regulator Rcp1